MLDLCTPDVHRYPDAAVFPEAEPTMGLEPLKSFLVGSAAPWVRPCYPISEASELGDDRVLRIDLLDSLQVEQLPQPGQDFGKLLRLHCI